MYQIDVSAQALADAAPWPAPAVADPVPLPPPARSWAHWVGLAISGATLAAILVQIRHVDFGEVLRLLPKSGAFWLTFFACYFAAPFSDWLIFRRLWRVPPSGFLALLRKYIGNEVLLGYIGEVYFYAWARKRSHMTGAPFGAVKDVTILSALVGNAVTLVMVALAYPFLGDLPLGMIGKTFYLSTSVLAATSLAAMAFRGRLFSLPRIDLIYVAKLHLARILVTTGLAALMWHLILPAVPLGLWLLLAAFRLLLSRLPFLPNKDFVFAGLAVLLIGHDSEVAALLTLMASLILTTHILVGAAVMGTDLAGAEGSG